MLTSATGIRTTRDTRHRGAGGFTLLELLVVIAIVALLSAVVALSIAGLGGRRVADEAERIAALLRLAEDEAVLRGRDLGLLIDAEDIAFVTWRRSADGRDIEWQPLADDPQLRPRRRSAGVEYRFEGGTGERDGVPQILIPADGLSEPFELVLRLPDEAGAESRVSRDLEGRITVSHGPPP